MRSDGMTASNHPQQARPSVMLAALRIPTVKRLMGNLCAQSDRGGGLPCAC
jgi:hypothetical protein